MLKKKWNSSRGASILMALLFLVICMMVGASVLMAASSNAGKVRSNREEHQRYLALSSALTLLCDELESVEYHGRYDYERKEVTHREDDGQGGTREVFDYYLHTYTQKPGEIRKKDNAGDWELNQQVLPLYNDLDWVFAGNFPSFRKDGENEYHYVPFTKIVQSGPYTLELAVEAGEAYGILAEPVVITAELRANDGGISLTASLKEHPEYVMRAVLKAKGKLKELLVLDSSVVGENPHETKRVTWTLDYIVKKEAG